MPRKRLGSPPGMREGCSVWHPDNVSLGESPPCAAAGARVPGAGIAKARCHPRNKTRKSSFLVQEGTMGEKPNTKPQIFLAIRLTEGWLVCEEPPKQAWCLRWFSWNWESGILFFLHGENHWWWEGKEECLYTRVSHDLVKLIWLYLFSLALMLVVLRSQWLTCSFWRFYFFWICYLVGQKTITCVFERCLCIL